MTTCDRCGAALKVGDYPFCKTGPEDHVPSEMSVLGDDIPGGYVVRHGLTHSDGSPQTFYSKSAIEKAAKAKNLTPYVVHVPSRGSDKSKHTQRWV